MSDGDGRSWLKAGLLGCGGCGVLVAAVVVGALVWLASTPEGGVKLVNEMDPYALAYLDEHALLDHDEKLVAYYDATLAMDGTEAAILTHRRVMYHKDGRTMALELARVVDIRHRTEPLIGDVIEIDAEGGEAMKIEIAPLNQGATFLGALDRVWRQARGEGPATPAPVEAEP